MQPKKYTRVIEEDGFYFFECPHCGSGVLVKMGETNCKIFRHAVYAHSGRQIGPHTSQKRCDRLFSEGRIVGCAKPFLFVFDSENGNYVTPCGYI